MKNYYITIARQFGSLGRPIARELSEILGIEYYDRDIVELTARKMNKTVSNISEYEEKTYKSNFFNMLFPLGNEAMDSQNKIFEAQSQIITEYAERGSCIVVGRCADYILNNYENCFNVFIYAPKEQRYLNCVNTLKMEPTEAIKMMDEVDKARERYYIRYAGWKPDDYEHCQMMIDSSILGVSGTAQVLADIVRKKYAKEE